MMETMVLPAAPPKFETDPAGQILYPVDNGEPLSNDTEHLKWITFLKDGLEDWFGDREDVFIAADLLWYPVEGRPDISKAPDVMVVLDHPDGTWASPVLGMVFGLDPKGRLWVRRPDGKLVETRREVRLRAEAEAKRADEAEALAAREAEEAAKASRLAAKLRELGMDPDSI
jgi:hypothetical protein